MNCFRPASAVVAAALLSLGTISLVARPAVAHETDCSVCKLKVVQDTPTQDNEVALRYGRKRIEYRCLACALADAAKYTGDVTLLAPSEAKARPVVLSRTGGNWSAPAGAVFLSVNADHRVCYAANRAFSGRAAFDAYVKQNAPQTPALKNARPFTLAQALDAAKTHAAR